MRQMLVVISYVPRRTSCLPRTVCMYTRQTVLSYEVWPPHFLLARHLTTQLSSPILKNKHWRRENRCKSTLSRDNTHGIFNEVARCIRVPAARLSRLRRPKSNFFNILNYVYRRSIPICLSDLKLTFQENKITWSVIGISKFLEIFSSETLK